MRIINPSFKIEYMTMAPLVQIEKAGRTCYKSEDKITSDSAKKFAEKVVRRGHESVIEHAYASVRIICDRGVSHEIVRHRLASYSQESTRYCNYGKDEHITFIKPCFFPNIPIGKFKDEQSFDAINPVGFGDAPEVWISSMLYAEDCYMDLLRKGLSPQLARSVLPNSLKTEIIMTCNLREWRHFFKLRTAKAAHPQMREIAIPMLAQFKKLVPIIFDDIKND